MKHTHVLALLFVVALISCQKAEYPDNLTVLINESGTLSFNVLDNENVGIENAHIRVYSHSSGITLIEDSTDASGIFNSGSLLQGEYSCYVSAKKNGLTYTENWGFQIIAGETKSIEVKPYLNVGDVELSIIDYYSFDSIPFLKVALLNDYYNNNEIDFDNVISESLFLGETNIEGKVVFKDIPAGESYHVFLYYDNTNYEFPSNGSYVYAYKNEFKKYTIRTDLNPFELP